MDSQTQLPTFTLAIYVGVLAGLVVFAVAFTMLRVYAYRHRLSTVTMSASYDANADANSNALIATTLSALGSPLPDYPDEPPATSKISVISSFGNNRWQQVKSFIARVRDRGFAAWSSLRQRLATRRAAKATASKPEYRVSHVDVEIATPCNNQAKGPCQLSLFQSPTSNDIGMI
ncbi:uncharacterized protein PITG_15247 [Phytophthora infestans T30-4]|uniref:Uncharacterized protein n=1 Tax=Phytophthora infestans (strain T30-4) TaxID=403677 RepID=D0NQ88_PHYIT|nr:uncharacterized protein PITG_15247 [Phytophthora infestans T30-4]EEY62820.1 conserved hypothetical protein [Phytophthora infestans T30-4]|eukprot:XP_002898695.1 conserved hypothetical protein [Phytophthora infestans T30-4]